MREKGPVRDEIGPWYVDTEWPSLWLDLNLELTYWPNGPSNRALTIGKSLGENLRTNILNGHLADNFRRSDVALKHCFNASSTQRVGQNVNDSDGVASTAPPEYQCSDAMSIGASSNQMHTGGDLGNLMWVTNDVYQICDYEYNASCFLTLALPPMRGALGAYRHLLAYNLNGTPSSRLHLFPTDSPAGYPGPPGEFR